MILEAFAGPGGWSTGLRMAGYDGPAAGVEWDRDACRTAVAAGHWRVQADVAAFPLDHLAGKVTGVILSPPCPTWSTAGDGAGKVDLPNVLRLIADFAAGRIPGPYEWEDVRSRLTAEPMRWASALRPRWIALEQVPPVLPIWRYTAELLRKQGYRTWCGVLSAEEFGVPQTRKRAILVASLDGPVGPPPPTHQRHRSGRDAMTEPDLFGDLLPPPISMAEALGWGLPDRPSWTVSGGGTDTGGAEVFANAGNREKLRQIVLRTGNNSMVTGRTGSRRGDGDVQPYERSIDAPAPTLDTNVGSKWRLAPAGATSEMVEPHPGSDPAHTITGKGIAAWVSERPATTVCGDARLGAPGHRDREGGERQFGDESVRVTVQEAGILQSFPAGYPWQGTKTAQYRQCGDAVPPMLAAAILRPLLAASAGLSVAA